MGVKTIVAFFVILILPVTGTYLALTSYVKDYFTNSYVNRLENEVKIVYDVFGNELNTLSSISKFVTENTTFRNFIKQKNTNVVAEKLKLMSENINGINTVFLFKQNSDFKISSRDNSQAVDNYMENTINKTFKIKSGMQGYDSLPASSALFGDTSGKNSFNNGDSVLVYYNLIPFNVGGENYVLGNITLLNDYKRLMDKIYNSFTYNTAVFSAVNLSDKIVATNSSPRNILFMNLNLPDNFVREIDRKQVAKGIFDIEGVPTALAAIPLKNASGKVVGGISIATNLNHINQLVSNFKRIVTIIIILSSIIVIITGAIVYHDTKKPINSVINAMRDVSENKLDVRLNFRTYDDFEDIAKYFNIMVESIEENTTKINRYNHLNSLITSTLDVEKVLEVSLDKIIEYSSSQIGVIYFYDLNSNKLTPFIGKNIEFHNLESVSLNEGLVGYVAKTKTYFCINDISPENLSINAGIGDIIPNEIAAFPINIKEELLGVMVLGSVSSHKKEELDMINNLLTQVAIVLDNCLTHAKISELSIKDEMTKIYNRRYLLQVLETEISRFKRYKTPLCVGIFDIDNFKRINDTHGHPVGDDVLRVFSRLIYENKRETDIFGRFGGEEFMIILPNTSKKDLQETLEKFRKIIEENIQEEIGFNVTASIGGVACDDLENVTVDEIILAADKKLYEAKSSGKNIVLI